jgi:hypothetical protein
MNITNSDSDSGSISGGPSVSDSSRVTNVLGDLNEKKENFNSNIIRN